MVLYEHSFSGDLEWKSDFDLINEGDDRDYMISHNVYGFSPIPKKSRDFVEGNPYNDDFLYDC